MESSVVVVIFCYTKRIANIKHKINHLLYEYGWPSGLSDRRSQGFSGSSPVEGYIFSFFKSILDVLLGHFRSNVYIYQYKALHDKLQ